MVYTTDIGRMIKEEKPHLLNYLKRIHKIIMVNSPGMRIIKTSIAILLCLLIDHFRQPEGRTDAAIAAIVCLGQDLESTWNVSLNRVLGTFIAGIYAGLFMFFTIDCLRIASDGLLYIVLIGLFTAPLMQLIVRIKKPGAVVITAIVFLTVTVNVGNANPWLYTVTRVFNTLIGVGIAIFVNWFPPLNVFGEKLKQVQIRGNE